MLLFKAVAKTSLYLYLSMCTDSLSITLAGISVGMLGFASKSLTDPRELPSVHIAEVTAFMLMACAIYICVYALFLFLWRA
jgi:hypothetical protein